MLPLPETGESAYPSLVNSLSPGKCAWQYDAQYFSKDILSMVAQMLKIGGFIPLSADKPNSYVEGHERRCSLRVDLPFPAIVRGFDTDGSQIVIHTVLDNFSASGLYVRLPKPVEQSKPLLVIVRLAIATADEVCAPSVAVRGNIVRMEPHADGRCGVAVAFQHHRFLYAASS